VITATQSHQALQAKMNRFKPQSMTIRFGLQAVFQIGGGENRALASENVTVIVGFEAVTQVVRRAEIDGFQGNACHAFEDYVPVHVFQGYHIGYNAGAAERTISAILATLTNAKTNRL
jgi:hypothetical protein